MDYFNIFTVSCVLTIVAFVGFVMHENYKYKKNLYKLMKYKKQSE